MKAMILAAGLGTRLRPLTNDRPKALVEVGGQTLLEITLSRLRAFGIHEVIINAHHFAEMILQYLETNHNFGMHIEVSREEILLDTGGGLKKAGHFFLEDSKSANSAFLVHNVDVVSTIDLDAWRSFMLSIRRSPPWPCKTGRLPGICSSTNNCSCAAGGPATRKKVNWCGLAGKCRHWAFAAFM